MSTWIKLSPKEVHQYYHVPIEVAAANGNTFFGQSDPLYSSPYHDGPWTLISFLACEPDIFRFQICHIEAEALESIKFNPLNDNSYALIEKQEVIDLIDILYVYANDLKTTAIQQQSMFKEIGEQDLIKYCLQDSIFPDMKQYFYIQTYNPYDKNHDEITTIINLNTNLNLSSPYLGFHIAQFPIYALKDPHFNPREVSSGGIYLNKHGLLELASILKNQMIYLADY